MSAPSLPTATFSIKSSSYLEPVVYIDTKKDVTDISWCHGAQAKDMDMIAICHGFSDRVGVYDLSLPEPQTPLYELLPNSTDTDRCSHASGSGYSSVLYLSREEVVAGTTSGHIRHWRLPTATTHGRGDKDPGEGRGQVVSKTMPKGVSAGRGAVHQGGDVAVPVTSSHTASPTTLHPPNGCHGHRRLGAFVEERAARNGGGPGGGGGLSRILTSFPPLGQPETCNPQSAPLNALLRAVVQDRAQQKLPSAAHLSLSATVSQRARPVSSCPDRPLKATYSVFSDPLHSTNSGVRSGPVWAVVGLHLYTATGDERGEGRGRGRLCQDTSPSYVSVSRSGAVCVWDSGAMSVQHSFGHSFQPSCRFRLCFWELLARTVLTGSSSDSSAPDSTLQGSVFLTHRLPSAQHAEVESQVQYLKAQYAIVGSTDVSPRPQRICLTISSGDVYILDLSNRSVESPDGSPLTYPTMKPPTEILPAVREVRGKGAETAEIATYDLAVPERTVPGSEMRSALRCCATATSWPHTVGGHSAFGLFSGLY